MGEFIHAYKCIYLLLSIYIIYLFSTPQSYFLGILFVSFRPPNRPLHYNYYVLEIWIRFEVGNGSQHAIIIVNRDVGYAHPPDLI